MVMLEQVDHEVVRRSFQRLADHSHVLASSLAWTYWNSEFTVVGLALLWVYLRRNESFVRFRNTILLANVIGLIGYVLLPTAPPRMYGDFGFVDSLGQLSGLNHGSGLIQLAANPYAAMPSLHAADALIVGVTLAELVASGKTPDLIAPFAMGRFHTDTLVSELAAAAVSH